jgi:cysteine desulfurase/selenocysteine lyase
MTTSSPDFCFSPEFWTTGTASPVMHIKQSQMGLSVEQLSSARALFPFTRNGTIYLNHASTSPLSTRVVESIITYLKERSEGLLETYPRDKEIVRECRQLVQRLIGAESPDRIALVGSTTDAINIVASGIEWHTGDRILSNTMEFPANVYPYLNLRQRGVELDVVHTPEGTIPPEMIADAMTPRTRLLALSAVQFLSGYRADLASIGGVCRKKKIVFVVDGIQAVGAIRVNVQEMNIDALAAGAQKWQMAPHGSGFLYLTEALQAHLKQQSLGWLSVQDPWDFFNYEQPLASTARRYEGGSLNIPSLRGMHAALATLLDFGMEHIEEQIAHLTALLTEQFQEVSGLHIYSPLRPKERAGIVTIDLPGNVDGKAVLNRLTKLRITAALRHGKLRFSPHFYNSAEEMHRTVSATMETLSAAGV